MRRPVPDALRRKAVVNMRRQEAASLKRKDAPLHENENARPRKRHAPEKPNNGVLQNIAPQQEHIPNNNHLQPEYDLNQSFGGYRTAHSVPFPSNDFAPAPYTPETIANNAPQIYATMHSPAPLNLLTQGVSPAVYAGQEPPPLGFFDVPVKRRVRRPQYQNNNGALSRPRQTLDNGTHSQQSPPAQIPGTGMENAVFYDPPQIAHGVHETGLPNPTGNYNINDASISDRPSHGYEQERSYPPVAVGSTEANLQETYDPVLLGQLDELLGPIKEYLAAADAVSEQVSNEDVSVKSGTSKERLEAALEGTKRKRSLDVDEGAEDGTSPKKARTGFSECSPDVPGPQQEEQPKSSATPVNNQPENSGPRFVDFADFLSRKLALTPTSRRPKGRFVREDFWNTRTEFDELLATTTSKVINTFQYAHTLVQTQPEYAKSNKIARWDKIMEMLLWHKEIGANHVLATGNSFSQFLKTRLPEKLNLWLREALLEICSCLKETPDEFARTLTSNAVKVAKSGAVDLLNWRIDENLKKLVSEWKSRGKPSLPSPAQLKEIMAQTQSAEVHLGKRNRDSEDVQKPQKTKTSGSSRPHKRQRRPSPLSQVTVAADLASPAKSATATAEIEMPPVSADGTASQNSGLMVPAILPQELAAPESSSIAMTSNSLAPRSPDFQSFAEGVESQQSGQTLNLDDRPHSPRRPHPEGPIAESTSAPNQTTEASRGEASSSNDFNSLFFSLTPGEIQRVHDGWVIAEEDLM